MKEKFDLLQWKLIAIIVFISIWAGTIKFSERSFKDTSFIVLFVWLLTDILTASFFGIIGFLLSRELGFGLNGSAAISGVVAYEGIKFVKKVENAIIEVIKSYSRLSKK